MSTYLVGDIHGCYDELISLLSQVYFNPQKDTLWLTGDLIARGPKSAELLVFLFSFKEKIKLVLGNHDLHLIAAYYGIKNNKNKKYINFLPKNKDSKKLIKWLKSQPFIQIDYKKKIFMSHAGISPQWNIKTAKNYSDKLHFELLNNYFFLLNMIYNKDSPVDWKKCINTNDKLRFSLNVFTKMRYCNSNGEINMNFEKSFLKNFISKIKPWFFISNKKIEKFNIIFGHWSSVGLYYNMPKKIIPLDTGCCWGNYLTMLRWEDKKFFSQKSLMNK